MVASYTMTTHQPPFTQQKIADVFASYPAPQRDGALQLRALIFEMAKEDARVGALSESLKWGQPSYVPTTPNIGTPIRIGLPKSGGFALFAHCQTTVISEFAALFAQDFNFDGTRAVLFAPEADIHADKLALLIRRALTYHL
jgi:hypothetical protein